MATTISNGESGSSVRTKLNNIWEGLQINEIDTSIADTAVDVFVYDTRKDSDGGAWRKRTQHTSWYNETLNTATRGSRKEFPAVAVIVVHSLSSTGKVTIYDGDDPDLPMWMVMNGNNAATDMLPTFGGTSLSCVTALNGVIAIGNSTYDLAAISFIEDAGYKWITSTRKKYNGNIEQREDGLSYTDVDGDGIVNRAVNDVAMTVLPNAPIDAATGLPVPTIAVATDGGWSQISDDGNVYDFAFSTNPHVSTIGFKKYKDTVLVTWNGDSNQFSFDRGYFEHPLLTADKTSQDSTDHDGSTANENQNNPHLYHPQVIAGASNGNFSLPNYFASNDGLSIFDGLYENRVNAISSKGMVAYTTSDYATGWMNGDIKLATLSDTYDYTLDPLTLNNVTGSELVTNGTFDTDSDWTKGAGWTIGSGVASSDGTQTGNSQLDAINTSTLVAGKTYVLSYTVTRTAGTVRIRVDGEIDYQSVSSSGTYSYTFTASGGDRYVKIRSNLTFVGTVDNVTLRLAEEDRSVNGNGLQVFGTVTKSAVATGADLVGYSGFSASNYLQQPYNADLDFGTGDFCIMGWVKADASSVDRNVLSRFNDARTTGFDLYVSAGGNAVFRTANASSFSNLLGSANLENNVWAHVVCNRVGDTMSIYVNGSLDISDGTKTNRDVDTSEGTVHVGLRRNGTAPFGDGSLALWRISATAPSPEAIKRIYEDEKVLFQENAKAVLYGASDAVTALAFDDTTNLLHVGTSAGRSVFQGLRRVDNTTTGVTTAISASNGLVVDQ